ncbi:MAG: sialidase family protein, partial [Verrucomicrobiota bacterium]
MKKLTVFLLLFLGIAWPLAAVPRADLDLSLVPPVVNTRPGPEYQDEARRGAMIIGMDRTPRGRIWACWTGTGDNAESYFILATSDDDGTTWSKPRVVIDPKDTPGKPPLRSLVGNLWCDPTGRLWLFFDQSLGVFDGRAGDWFITCDNPDAAEPVWSQPVRFADGCTLNKPTVLKNGEWLLPVSLWHRQHIIPSLFKEEYHELDSQRMAHVYISTNQGKSWTRRGGVVIPKTDFDEHTIVERRDGQLWMLARTLYGVAESFSSDAGRTWSEPQPSAIKNVSARMFIRSLASGRLLLVKNGPTDQRLPGRSHMSAFLSDDDGKTFAKKIEGLSSPKLQGFAGGFGGGGDADGESGLWAGEMEVDGGGSSALSRLKPPAPARMLPAGSEAASMAEVAEILLKMQSDLHLSSPSAGTRGGGGATHGSQPLWI